MKNKVKYAPVRKYRDVGYNEVSKTKPNIKLKKSFNIKK